jgi:diguanylate cyclase (GGDEF)-like protein
MLYSRIEDELKETNDDLQTAQEVLRHMADRDPMTGLANRRALPGIWGEVQQTGATLLFFDLNEFKQINDVHGHHAGDECLRRFAGALQAGFRPDDHLVRYAGDEFLVIAAGLPKHREEEIFENMRANLSRRARSEDENGMPQIRFSVGRADLEPGGDPESAVKAADEAMYTDKAARKAAR